MPKKTYEKRKESRITRSSISNLKGDNFDIDFEEIKHYIPCTSNVS